MCEHSKRYAPIRTLFSSISLLTFAEWIIYATSRIAEPSPSAPYLSCSSFAQLERSLLVLKTNLDCPNISHEFGSVSAPSICRAVFRTEIRSEVHDWWWRADIGVAIDDEDTYGTNSLASILSRFCLSLIRFFKVTTRLIFFSFIDESDLITTFKLFWFRRMSQNLNLLDIMMNQKKKSRKSSRLTQKKKIDWTERTRWTMNLMNSRPVNDERGKW